MTVRGNDVPYSQDVADRICAEIADGLSLRTVCNADDMPSRVSVFRWIRENEDFKDRFDRARKEGAHALVDDMQGLADDETLDPNSRRIRVDTRKWIASKMLPKVYGEKVQLSGDENGSPIVVSWLQGAR